ncbi:MAG: Fic/DOC family N-terminal domain-containing protein [Hyphomicrobiaceae bacterium]
MNRNHLTHLVREQLKRYPKPWDNHYGVVPLPPTEEPVTLGAARAALDSAIASIGRADALAKTYPNHFLLSRVLVRQEAVTSSAIEGTYSTLDHLLEMEESDDEEDAEGRQVRSYAWALERALGQIERNRCDGFSVGLIRDLQREVVKDDPDYRNEPGRIRDHVVWIGGGKHIAQSIYNPTPPADISTCLAHHIDYLRCVGLQQVNQSIVVRMAIAHAHFEAIHPFPNGNGRTGRLLLPLMMAADGHTPLYLAAYIAANRPSYMDGLRAAQQRLEYAPLIEVLSRAIVATVDMAETAHSDLFRLYVDWNNRHSWRKNSTARRALDLLVGFPVVTIKRLASELDVSAQAASVAAHQLIEAKVLTEKTGHRRNRVFVASEVLRLYNRTFSDEPIPLVD